MCFDASECLTKVVLCFPFFRNVKICFAKAIVNFDFALPDWIMALSKYTVSEPKLLSTSAIQKLSEFTYLMAVPKLLSILIFSPMYFPSSLSLSLSNSKEMEGLCPLFFEDQRKSMLPSNAAPKIVHGVRAVIPSQSSYMIHINAMENRISQKFTLRIPFKKSQIKNTVNKTLNTLISGMIQSLLTTT